MILRIANDIRIACWWSLVLFFVGFISCKKDQLSIESVTQIGPYTDGRLNRIHFVNDQLGFVIGGNRFDRAEMLITKDGGKSWLYKEFPEAGKGLYGICHSQSGTIYTVGFDGKLLYSEDNGESWIFRQLNYRPYRAIAFAGADEGMAVGGVSFDQGFLFRMNHEGYHLQDDSVGYELNDIHMVSDQLGYMAGYGILMKTTDGGKNWQFTSLRTDNFTGLYCLDAHKIWVCGFEGSIYKSEDGGANWQKLRNGNNIVKKKYRLLDIVFLDEQQGYAVGEEGTVIYSKDGGENWTQLKPFTKQSLRSVAVAPDGSILVAGDNGAFYRLSL